MESLSIMGLSTHVHKQSFAILSHSCYIYGDSLEYRKDAWVYSKMWDPYSLLMRPSLAV